MRLQGGLVPRPLGVWHSRRWGLGPPATPGARMLPEGSAPLHFEGRGRSVGFRLATTCEISPVPRERCLGNCSRTAAFPQPAATAGNGPNPRGAGKWRRPPAARGRPEVGAGPSRAPCPPLFTGITAYSTKITFFFFFFAHSGLYACVARARPPTLLILLFISVAAV